MDAKGRLLGSRPDPGESNVEVASHNESVYSHLVSDDTFDAKGRLLVSRQGESNVEVVSLNKNVYSHDVLGANGINAKENNVDVADLGNKANPYLVSDMDNAKERPESLADPMDSDADDVILLVTLVLKAVVDELAAMVL